MREGKTKAQQDGALCRLKFVNLAAACCFISDRLREPVAAGGKRQHPRGRALDQERRVVPEEDMGKGSGWRRA